MSTLSRVSISRPGAGSRAVARPIAVFGIVALAIAGAALHDIVEFGAPSARNTLSVAVISAGLTLAWSWQPRRWIASVLLLFGAIFLAGALTSVLPLAIWPWEPEQSIAHYAVHGAWALMLIPLLVTANRMRIASAATTHRMRKFDHSD